MKRLFLFAMLLTAPVIANSQNFSLPTLYLDSLLYMATKYQVCDSVRDAQANEIVKTGRELIETGTALRLSQNESKSLQGLVENAAKDKEADKKQHNLDLNAEKKKTKKWRRTAIIVILAIIAKEGLDALTD